MDKMSNLEKSLVADYLKEYENLCLGKTEIRDYADGQMRRAQKLWELCPENPLYHLMQAAVLIRTDKKEAGEQILKKYERNHALQFRNPEFRACFLYLAGMLTEDAIQRRNIVIQLQKLYQKNPTQPSLYWYLTQLDEGFQKNPEKKMAFLEKQRKSGCRQNLLYLEAVLTLRAYPDIVDNMETFYMQCYIWAQRRHCITREMGEQIAQTAMKLKKCDHSYEYLIRECYRTFATKELLAALCSLYIRAGRTDQVAAAYYSEGVEYELKLNNLYEYYMMSTADQKKKLLPEQVLLHFLYHDTLTSAQKVYLYKNLISYGDPKSEIYEKHIEKIEKYTVDSLLKRRISPEYAFLYDRILYPNIFTKEMAEAMADLMFLRKLSCTDSRIREVEVSYPQLRTVKRIPLKKQQAYVPIYSPTAVITLVDDEGNLYRNSVPYQLERMLDEKKYMEVCRKHVKEHAGLLLCLCAKKPEQIKITQDTLDLYRQIPGTKGFADDYRNAVLLKLMEYAAAEKKLKELPKQWFDVDGKEMSREERGRMITFLTHRGMYADAFQWLEAYGAVHVPANIVLRILTALEDREEEKTELYYRLTYGCFQNNQMNYTSLKYLAASFLGTCSQMRDVWKKAKSYGVDTHEMEERILIQMMFTGTFLPEHFDIYLSYSQRGPKEYVKKAYLTYFSREAFAKNKELDSRFYFILEEELLKNQGYTEICKLAYLKYLSEKETVSTKQKLLLSEYLRYFFSKNLYYSFMQNFGKIVTEALILEDKLFAEYYAPSTSEVILHYILEREGEEVYHYTTCRLYPAYGGVFSKAFPMFLGDKITYFITEKREDGTELSTPSVTMEKRETGWTSNTRYARINRIREAFVTGQKKEVSQQMKEFCFLEMAAEELFEINKG